MPHSDQSVQTHSRSLMQSGRKLIMVRLHTGLSECNSHLSLAAKSPTLPAASPTKKLSFRSAEWILSLLMYSLQHYLAWLGTKRGKPAAKTASWQASFRACMHLSAMQCMQASTPRQHPPCPVPDQAPGCLPSLPCSTKYSHMPISGLRYWS